MDDNVGQHDFAVTISRGAHVTDGDMTHAGMTAGTSIGGVNGTRSGSSTTVQVHGDFDRNACVRFERAVGEVDRSTTVIVDIGESSTIDSSAIGSLVRLHSEVQAADGEFSVVVARPFQRRIFEITDLTAHLHVVDRSVEGQSPT